MIGIICIIGVLVGVYALFKLRKSFEVESQEEPEIIEYLWYNEKTEELCIERLSPN